MRIDWDYSDVADAYDKRPGYAPSVLEECVHIATASHGATACDVGAGTGRLTTALLARGLGVVAVEPNAAMRARGRLATAPYADVAWIVGCGEALPFRDGAFRLVAFGSSLNVVDPRFALKETARVLAPGGWLFCVWNHRKLDDPLQARIEAVIRARVPDYAYGARRDDQSSALEASGWFDRIRCVEGSITHRSTLADCRSAWRSHLTLRRQAGPELDRVLHAIDAELERTGSEIEVPYVSRAWLARKR